MLEFILAWSQFGLLGTLGGLASYFYPPSTDVRFTWRNFIGKLVISFFIGKVAGEFIPNENTFKSGYIMVLGFFAYPVLAVIEAKVKTWVESYKPPGAL
ncbi:hypothetical protein [Pseudomonas sp. SLFW]|uniref:hypothetical protein n=1 Tax=Pseudomonas sp. SLFW TaxID=2683259 RepID=UPI0014127DEE|nr:hypothetical protein [Pseudomonas sp. SLFW]NBB11805.1 hypothetical protein [Pseudomonas sp. SLFW]